jgi:hypothetical protein
MTKHVWLLVLLLCGACSSTHDLKRDGPNYLGGGGFIDDEIAPGVYRIKGFSNTSPFATPDSAAKTFLLRAKQLCTTGYEEVRSVADSYQSSLNGGLTVAPSPKTLAVTLLLPPPVITSKIGFIRCDNSPLSLYEAQMLVAPERE